MLIILLSFALIRTLHGIPLSLPSEALDDFTALDTRNTQSHFSERSVNDIVISCLATIFACTWSAIHPNIPAVTDSAWTRFKRQIVIMIYALLTPELITVWALRQRRGACQIMDEYNKLIHNTKQDSEENPGYQVIFDNIRKLFQDLPLSTALGEDKGPQWTLTHGFFLEMGGYMLCEGGRPIQTLGGGWFKDEKIRIIWNIKKGIIDPPRITEEDIKDRSKGDAISKTLIVLQTTWFIVQCIARWSQRLPVTELEVVTLGFAMLNGVTYGLWWNKPQNVGRPVFLEMKKPYSSNGIPSDPSTINDSSPSTNVEIKPCVSQSNLVKESWLQRKLRTEIEEHAYSPILLWRTPYRVLQAILRPLGKMAGDETFTKMRVGMFYTLISNDPSETGYAMAAISALFGSVHLIPSWFLDFPSPQEMWLWRVSAIIITVEPILIVGFFYFGSIGQNVLGLIFVFPAITGIPFYIISRIMLLTLSLTSLRSLPSATLKTIEWTTFIPHL